MPEITAPLPWSEVAVAFAVVAVAAFLVTWFITDVLHIGRAWYIAILSATVAGLAVGYVTWADISVTDLVTTNAWLGVAGGVVAAALVFPLVRRMPRGPRAAGARLGGQLLWEAGVYGVAEALLLATLPVLVVWQGVPDGGGVFAWQRVGWGALMLAAALVVILVHHLGYAEFRARGGRTKLAGALVSCGIQALALILTGSLLAPIAAHILLHVQLIVRGVEMPPVRRETPSAQPERPVREVRELTTV